MIRLLRDISVTLDDGLRQKVLMWYSAAAVTEVADRTYGEGAACGKNGQNGTEGASHARP